MAIPVLDSISPSSGSPGTAIACLGSGFDPAARVACPLLVATTFVSAGQVRAAMPADLMGPAGSSVTVSVYVQNADGSRSAALPFELRFPATLAQCWTSVESVCAEVPGFQRGGDLGDATIQQWIRGVAQEIAGALLRRGLSLNPAEWQQPDAGSMLPSPAAILDHINSHGAAVHLAAWIAARFTAGGAEWSLGKSLTRAYERELEALQSGAYDKLFRQGAATIESGVQVSGGDIRTDSGDADQAFSKDQVF